MMPRIAKTGKWETLSEFLPGMGPATQLLKRLGLDRPGESQSGVVAVPSGGLAMPWIIRNRLGDPVSEGVQGLGRRSAQTSPAGLPVHPSQHFMHGPYLGRNRTPPDGQPQDPPADGRSNGQKHPEGCPGLPMEQQGAGITDHGRDHSPSHPF